MGDGGEEGWLCYMWLMLKYVMRSLTSLSLLVQLLSLTVVVVVGYLLIQHENVTLLVVIADQQAPPEQKKRNKCDEESLENSLWRFGF